MSDRAYFQGLRDTALDFTMQSYYDAWLAMIPEDPCQHLPLRHQTVMTTIQHGEMVTERHCQDCRRLMTVTRVPIWQ